MKPGLGVDRETGSWAGDLSGCGERGAHRELGGGSTEEGAEGWKGGGVLKVAVGREGKADSPRGPCG